MSDIRYISDRIIPLDKGDYVYGATYQKMDMVTDITGSTYISKVDDNKDIPHKGSTNWRLIAKGGSGNVVVDESLSTESSNAVQNKAIATAVEQLNQNIQTLQSEVEKIEQGYVWIDV